METDGRKKREDPRSDFWGEFPVAPSNNHRLGRSGVGFTYQTAESKAYQDEVRWVMIRDKVKPFTGDVGMEIKWYRKQKKGDVMERGKDLCDALQATGGFGVYLNDKQVREYKITRSDEEPEKPRMVVHVWPIK